MFSFLVRKSLEKYKSINVFSTWHFKWKRTFDTQTFWTNLDFVKKNSPRLYNSSPSCAKGGSITIHPPMCQPPLILNIHHMILFSTTLQPLEFSLRGVSKSQGRNFCVRIEHPLLKLSARHWFVKCIYSFFSHRIMNGFPRI